MFSKDGFCFHLVVDKMTLEFFVNVCCVCKCCKQCMIMMMMLMKMLIIILILILLTIIIILPGIKFMKKNVQDENSEDIKSGAAAFLFNFITSLYICHWPVILLLRL